MGYCVGCRQGGRQDKCIGGFLVGLARDKDNTRNTEKMQLTIQADQRAILNNQGDFKKQLHEQSRLQIEQIKVNAELNAYLRTIDKIE